MLRTISSFIVVYSVSSLQCLLQVKVISLKVASLRRRRRSPASNERGRGIDVGWEHHVNNSIIRGWASTAEEE